MRAPSVPSRFDRRAAIAVEKRRVFPYLVAVTATTAVVTGLIAHLIDRTDFPSFGVGVWWAIQTLGTVGYGDVVPHTAWGRVLGGVVIVGGVTFLPLSLPSLRRFSSTRTGHKTEPWLLLATTNCLTFWER
jgi:hypothetical protein